MESFAHRESRRFPRGLAALAALALALMCLAGCALAEATPAPTGVPYDNQGRDPEHSIKFGKYHVLDTQDAQHELYTLKSRLEQFGYYDLAGVNKGEINWQNNMLDDDTWRALHECCKENGMMEFDDPDGLTYGAFYRVNDGDIHNLNSPVEPTEAPREYQAIAWGEGGDAFTAVVNRLYELSYLPDRQHTEYDEATRDAIDAFGKQNGYPKYFEADPNTPIGEDLQRTLLEGENLIPMPEITPEPTNGNYFLRKVSIAGLQVPMLALWCVCLAVLVACMVAVVYLFMPSDRKSDGGKAKKNAVRFTITYHGQTQQIEAEIDKELKIGRGVGNFPLNLEDAKISRRHCELYYLNDVLMLRDYSANGTFVNGKSVNNAECILSSGDTIEIGDHVINISF